MYSSYQCILGNRKSAEHLRIYRTWYYIFLKKIRVIAYLEIGAYIIGIEGELHKADKDLHAEMNIDLQQGTELCSALAIQNSH